jgi:hypothetical protein
VPDRLDLGTARVVALNNNLGCVNDCPRDAVSSQPSSFTPVSMGTDYQWYHMQAASGAIPSKFTLNPITAIVAAGAAVIYFI